MTAVLVALAVAVILLGFLVAGLLRSNAELTRAVHSMGFDLDPASPRAGASSPVALTSRPTPGRPDATDVIALTGTNPAGDAVSLAVASVDHDTLVAFLTSGCQTCRGFWETFRRSTPEVPGGARLVAVTRGPEAESPATLAQLAGDRVPVVMSSEAWEHYDVPYAPYFVYVSGPTGRVVGEGVAAGWEEVQALVANAVADGTTRPGRPQRQPGSGRARADLERESEIDQQLRQAGIEPGDPRLYPTSLSDTASSDTASSDGPAVDR